MYDGRPLAAAADVKRRTLGLDILRAERGWKRLNLCRYRPCQGNCAERAKNELPQEHRAARPRRNLSAAGSAGLPQHYLRRVMQFAHDEEASHWHTHSGSATSESLERTNRLHDAGTIGIRLQHRQRFKFAERHMVGLCEIHLVLRFGREALGSDLDQIQKAEGVYRNPALCLWHGRSGGLEVQARGITCFTQRNEVVDARATGNRMRYIHQSLRCLSDRHVCDHSIAKRVYDGGLNPVFQRYVDARTITGWPNAVWQIAHRDGRNQLWCCAPAKHFHYVQPPDGDIGKLAVAIVDEVGVCA